MIFLYEKVVFNFSVWIKGYRTVQTAQHCALWDSVCCKHPLGMVYYAHRLDKA